MKPIFHKSKRGYILNQDKTMVFTRDGWEPAIEYHLDGDGMKEILVEDYLEYINLSNFLSTYSTKLKSECIRLLKDYAINKAINDL